MTSREVITDYSAVRSSVDEPGAESRLLDIVTVPFDSVSRSAPAVAEDIGQDRVFVEQRGSVVGRVGSREYTFGDAGMKERTSAGVRVVVHAVSVGEEARL